MLNALTIDVEDYFQVSLFESVVERDSWEERESRVERNTMRLIELLDRHGTRATFFVLGWIAERYPNLVCKIAEGGHEIASHGYSHRRIYMQTIDEFQEETRKSKQILEDIIQRPILGYRAASYSIRTDSLWALEILQDVGFVYDSSIFPIRHDLYGIPNYPRFCQVYRQGGGKPFIEFPISTLRLCGTNIPIAGGGYFRLFPYAITRWGIKRLNELERRPAVVYLHPWEIDPDQPRVCVKGLSRLRHYVNLSKTEERFGRLLQDFRFGTMLEVLHDQHVIDCG